MDGWKSLSRLTLPVTSDQTRPALALLAPSVRRRSMHASLAENVDMALVLTCSTFDLVHASCIHGGSGAEAVRDQPVTVPAWKSRHSHEKMAPAWRRQNPVAAGRRRRILALPSNHLTFTVSDALAALTRRPRERPSLFPTG